MGIFLFLPRDELDKRLVQRDTGFRIEYTAVGAGDEVRGHNLG